MKLTRLRAVLNALTEGAGLDLLRCECGELLGPPGQFGGLIVLPSGKAAFLYSF
jgi:hypothetical protein